MNLSDLALIGADTSRTRAYLQMLVEGQYYLNRCYIMAEDPTAVEAAADDYRGTERPSAYFERLEPALYTLRKAGIPYTLIKTDSINSGSTIEIMKKAKEHNLVYSGFGGQIIKKEVFETGKTLIHVHSGILPQYRGSTTVYYSLLNEGFCGASAIIMALGLDSGEVVAESRFPMPPKGVDIDYIYDPYIRAKVLVEAVSRYLKEGTFKGRTQEESSQRTYYIAHPVLRHIVRLLQDSEGERKQ